MLKPGPPGRATQHNWFLKYRKLWLVATVCLAVGLNVYYVLSRSSKYGGSVSGLLKLRRSGLEKPPEDPAADFLGTAAAAAGDGRERADVCHAEQDAEYEGEEVLRWGSQFLVNSPEECCSACRTLAGCNVWVYCAAAGDGQCPVGRKPQECWLKKSAVLDVVRPQGRRTPGSGWVSGAMFTEAEHEQALVEAAQRKQRQEDALQGLRNNESLPLVFFDVTIKGQPAGRIEMVLFSDIAPRSAENFRQFCTGEHGVVPEGKENAGTAYHFKGAHFYRIIHSFIDQAGVYVDSVFGGPFADDPGGLLLEHDRKGLLSQANMGPDTNTAHFSIMMGPAPHLNRHYTIFGQVVAGLEVVDAINALSVGKPENTAGVEEEVVIAESGELRRGSLVPDLALGACGSKCPEVAAAGGSAEQA